MNIIPCTTWVKRGVAASVPEKVKLSTKEIEDIIKDTNSELQDCDSEDSDEEVDSHDETKKGKSAYSKKETPSTSNQSSLDEYDFDEYDKESNDVHCSIRNIVSFGENGKDPLVTIEDSDDDSEKEDNIVKTDDNLVVVGHVEGDASILEIFVYNEEEGSFYCLHDFLLPSFPLCVEWLNYDSTDPKPGNYCAIGTMSSVIEVWDLDVMDCLVPVYKLGCKPNKKKNRKRVGHKDAVLDLAWNQNYHHVLASGSVDQSVLLWDLEKHLPVTKLDAFEEKVQAVKWHPKETHCLLTGCADKVVRLFDCRDESIMKSWITQGEVERVLWNQFDLNHFLASTNNGYLGYYDMRNNEPIWEIPCHEKEITGLSLSSKCPGFLVTASNDSVIKVWDILNCTEPFLLWEKKSSLGAIQCLSPNPDSPYVFALGGDNKSHNFEVMDFRNNSIVYNRFKDRKCINPTVIKEEESMDIEN